MKNNIIYIIIYIVIAICLILIHYYLVETFTLVSYAPPWRFIIRDTIDYTVGWKQPAAIIPLLIYRIINLPLFHKLYVIFLCVVIFTLIIILILWLIGLIIKKIIFFNPFANISPWQELNEMGFFTWFFDRTTLEKNKDINMFVLNIYKESLSPEEYKAAQERCLKSSDSSENFENKKPGTFIIPSLPKLQLPHKEYIDYDLSKLYITEKKDDMFYTESFKSIKHREDANYYRNMVIARPDTIGDFTLPNIDIEEILNLNKSYLFI
jgi:hypothetical protein